MIYLDNNATTAVDPAVFEAMKPYFVDQYANPSSVHAFGLSTSNKVEKTRRLIAGKLRCQPDEIIFTGSGSEANNLCLKGFAYANQQRGKHLITTAIEHASILNTCAFLEKQGFTVTYLEVDAEGRVSPETLKKAIKPDTCLISIAHANNEIGTLQPLSELMEVSAGIAFHSDAIQSFLKTPLDTRQLPLSLASFSGHKIHAPKGIGFVFKRKNIPLETQIHGGQQEHGIRAGTENVPAIIGLGKAIEEFQDNHIHAIKELQTYLMAQLTTLPGIHINGPKDLNHRVCSNVNFSHEAFEGEDILYALSEEGICVSTGSACHSKQANVSHVLNAIGCPSRFIHGNIRVGLSKYTTKEEIDFFLSKLRSILASTPPCKLAPLISHSSPSATSLDFLETHACV